MDYFRKENGGIKLITLISILVISVILLLVLIGVIQYSKNNKSSINSHNPTNSQGKTEVENFSDDDIKESFQKYLDLSGALAGSPRNLLVELGLLEKNDTNGESVDVEGTPYITTSIKSSDFKNTMLKYVSEKCYEEEFTRWFKFFDWVYYFDGGATGRTFEVVSISKISETEYTAKVNEIMLDDSKELKEYKFNIINYNGYCVIDSVVEKENENQITFSNETVKSSLQKYLDLSGALAGSPRNLLVELGLLENNDTNGESVDVEGTPYITTNIKSSDFKNTMLKYVSEKCYEEEFTRWFKFFDWVYYFDGGATGRSFEVVSISKISETEYTAKVNEIMIDDTKELKEYKFNISNYNGNCVIDNAIEKEKENENQTTTFSNETVKSSLQKYLDLSGALAGSPRNLLVELGLLEKNDNNGESVDVEGTPYITTSIKSSDFKNTMLKYVSEKCYEEEFTRWFKFFDWVYYFDGGATGRTFEVVSISKISETEYTAKVNEIMLDDSKELKEYKFNIINYNEYCVIDSCTEN